MYFEQNNIWNVTKIFGYKIHKPIKIHIIADTIKKLKMASIITSDRVNYNCS